MNDKPSQESGNASSDSVEGSSGPLAGQRLAAARRANGVSIAEIAKELHLDEPKVQALEENLFEVLGAPVFAKGHLKKYAELVGVPPDDVLADYYQLNRAAGAPPVVGPRKQKPPRDIAPGPWIFGFLVAIVLAGAFYWWLSHESVTAPGLPGVLEPFASERDAADSESASESLQTGDPVDAEGDEEEFSPGVAQQDAPAEADGGAPVSVQIPGQEAAENIIGGLRLVMTFSGDCWTEVTDANGDRLFFGLGQAGQTVSRSGLPPLQALFGDRTNVSVTVDGVDFLLSGRGQRGNTARVTIESP